MSDTMNSFKQPSASASLNFEDSAHALHIRQCVRGCWCVCKNVCGGMQVERDGGMGVESE